MPIPVGPASALVLGSGCSDSLPSNKWGNYCHLPVDLYMKFENVLAKPTVEEEGFCRKRI